MNLTLKDLKGFAEWQASGASGMAFAPDVIPAGVRARLEEHTKALFDQQHTRAQHYEFAIRVARYAIEVEILLSVSDGRTTRRLIEQLQRYIGILTMSSHRSWLGLNTDGLYEPSERAQLIKVACWLMELEGKIARRQLALMETTLGSDDPCVAYLDDLITCISTVIEWLKTELRLAQHRPPLWSDLIVAPDTVAALNGVDAVKLAPDPSADGQTVFNTKQLAKFIGVSVPYIRQMRTYGTGPIYTKVKSGRGTFEERVFYALDDILAWLETKPDTLHKVAARNAPAFEALQTRRVQF